VLFDNAIIMCLGERRMRKAVPRIVFVVLLLGMLLLILKTQPVKALGTIYIIADGSIDPLTAPIQRARARLLWLFPPSQVPLSVSPLVFLLSRSTSFFIAWQRWRCEVDYMVIFMFLCFSVKSRSDVQV